MNIWRKLSNLRHRFCIPSPRRFSLQDLERPAVMVNIGCGGRFHPDWLNFDFVPANPQIFLLNALDGLPFPDCSVDVLYHSHMLEHLTQDQAHSFLQECNRVIKVGGIIRVAVPDLEQIAKSYLQALEATDAKRPRAESMYDWMLLELFDQMVRSEPGGQMLKYLAGISKEQSSFVVSRVGRQAVPPAGFKVPERRGKATEKRNELAEINFRKSGELHRWMYDRFSLSRLLVQHGFRSIQLQTALTSQILGFEQFELDAERTGEVRKPDSLFMEAIK